MGSLVRSYEFLWQDKDITRYKKSFFLLCVYLGVLSLSVQWSLYTGAKTTLDAIHLESKTAI